VLAIAGRVAIGILPLSSPLPVRPALRAKLLCRWLYPASTERHIDLGDRRNHSEPRQVVKHGQQRFVRADKPMPAQLSAPVGTANGQCLPLFRWGRWSALPEKQWARTADRAVEKPEHPVRFFQLCRCQPMLFRYSPPGLQHVGSFHPLSEGELEPIHARWPIASGNVRPRLLDEVCFRVRAPPIKTVPSREVRPQCLPGEHAAVAGVKPLVLGSGSENRPLLHVRCRRVSLATRSGKAHLPFIVALLIEECICHASISDGHSNGWRSSAQTAAYTASGKARFMAASGTAPRMAPGM
jgi:hypothetical protein